MGFGTRTQGNNFGIMLICREDLLRFACMCLLINIGVWVGAMRELAHMSAP